MMHDCTASRQASASLMLPLPPRSGASETSACRDDIRDLLPGCTDIALAVHGGSGPNSLSDIGEVMKHWLEDRGNDVFGEKRGEKTDEEDREGVEKQEKEEKEEDEEEAIAEERRFLLLAEAISALSEQKDEGDLLRSEATRSTTAAAVSIGRDAAFACGQHDATPRVLAYCPIHDEFTRGSDGGPEGFVGPGGSSIVSVVSDTSSPSVLEHPRRAASPRTGVSRARDCCPSPQLPPSPLALDEAEARERFVLMCQNLRGIGNVEADPACVGHRDGVDLGIGDRHGKVGVCSDGSKSMKSSSGAALRRDLLASSWPRGLPTWINQKRSLELLQQVGAASVDYEELLKQVIYASAAYRHPQEAAADPFVRVETLMACVEPHEEHVLTVQLNLLQGVERLMRMVKEREVCEFFLRCHLRGARQVVQTTCLQLPLPGHETFPGSLVATPTSTSQTDHGAVLDLTGTYTFCLSTCDSLEALFAAEFADDALVIELWLQDVGQASAAGMAAERRLLATARLPAVEVRTFMRQRSVPTLAATAAAAPGARMAKDDGAAEQLQARLFFYDDGDESDALENEVRLLSVSASSAVPAPRASLGSIFVTLAYTGSSGVPCTAVPPFPWGASFKGQSVSGFIDRESGFERLRSHATPAESLPLPHDHHMDENRYHMRRGRLDVALGSLTLQIPLLREWATIWSKALGSQPASSWQYFVWHRLRVIRAGGETHSLIPAASTCRCLQLFTSEQASNAEVWPLEQHVDMNFHYNALLSSLGGDRDDDKMCLLVELWLHGEGALCRRAELRLAEQVIPLQLVLTMAHQDSFGQVKVTVPFELGGSPAADLAISFAFHEEVVGPVCLPSTVMHKSENDGTADRSATGRPSDMGTLSEVLAEEKIGGTSPGGAYAERLIGSRNNATGSSLQDPGRWSVRVCEAWIAGETRLVNASVAGEIVEYFGDNAAVPCYYLELASAACHNHSGDQPLRHRVMPFVTERLAGGQWLWLDFSASEPMLTLPLNNDVDDGGLQNFPSRFELRLFRLSQGSAKSDVMASAIVKLEPLPCWLQQGTVAAYKVVRKWLPLLSGPDAIIANHVGAALAQNEGMEESMPSVALGRVLVEVASLPTGIEEAHAIQAESVRGKRMPSSLVLPLPGACDARCCFDSAAWPMEKCVRSVLGDRLCDALRADEMDVLAEVSAIVRNGPCGLCRVQDFIRALASEGRGEDLTFLKEILGTQFFGDTRSQAGVTTCALLAYVPLLHWVVMRDLARALRPIAAQALRACLDLDLERTAATFAGNASATMAAAPATVASPPPHATKARGTVPKSFLGEFLGLHRLEPLRTALWAFLEEWPAWTTKDANGDFSMDYITFFSDLVASGIAPKETVISMLNSESNRVPHGGQTQGTSEGDRGPAVVLQITNALHLPLVQKRFPNTYVTYRWQNTALDRPSRKRFADERDRLGTTGVIYRSTCPAWDYCCTVPLPPKFGQTRGCADAYPKAFQEATLGLYVWHSDTAPSADREGGKGSSGDREGEIDGSTFRRGTLLGVAEVTLAPLRSGLEEVDGYFHIAVPTDTDEDGEPEHRLSHGQIHVMVRPCYSSFCSALPEPESAGSVPVVCLAAVPPAAEDMSSPMFRATSIPPPQQTLLSQASTLSLAEQAEVATEGENTSHPRSTSRTEEPTARMEHTDMTALAAPGAPARADLLQEIVPMEPSTIEVAAIVPTFQRSSPSDAVGGGSGARTKSSLTQCESAAREIAVPAMAVPLQPLSAASVAFATVATTGAAGVSDCVWPPQTPPQKPPHPWRLVGRHEPGSEAPAAEVSPVASSSSSEAVGFVASGGDPFRTSRHVGANNPYWGDIGSAGSKIGSESKESQDTTYKAFTSPILLTDAAAIAERLPSHTPVAPSSSSVLARSLGTFGGVHDDSTVTGLRAEDDKDLGELLFIRESHKRNMAELDELQKRLLSHLDLESPPPSPLKAPVARAHLSSSPIGERCELVEVRALPLVVQGTGAGRLPPPICAETRGLENVAAARICREGALNGGDFARHCNLQRVVPSRGSTAGRLPPPLPTVEKLSRYDHGDDRDVSCAQIGMSAVATADVIGVTRSQPCSTWSSIEGACPRATMLKEHAPSDLGRVRDWPRCVLFPHSSVNESAGRDKEEEVLREVNESLLLRDLGDCSDSGGRERFGSQDSVENMVSERTVPAGEAFKEQRRNCMSVEEEDVAVEGGTSLAWKSEWPRYQPIQSNYVATRSHATDGTDTDGVTILVEPLAQKEATPLFPTPAPPCVEVEDASVTRGTSAATVATAAAGEADETNNVATQCTTVRQAVALPATTIDTTATDAACQTEFLLGHSEKSQYDVGVSKTARVCSFSGAATANTSGSGRCFGIHGGSPARKKASVSVTAAAASASPTFSVAETVETEIVPEASPRTDAGSEATTAATGTMMMETPERRAQTRGCGQQVRWLGRLDIQTQRIARIMRGGKRRGRHGDDASEEEAFTSDDDEAFVGEMYARS
eukprot:TRINITY_DN28973_c0_g1_i1.p1 TRINITY_DN28973_c0_g1~~TRINITY_DN28973_c0_g1_i1.p1  ORF type:complete len:2501 (+),score=387.81 TRINITY_DN28973_c0_g1_i1:228-7730(+)